MAISQRIHLAFADKSRDFIVFEPGAFRS